MTSRVQLRLPVESDRERFVELFTDDEFMVFAGACDVTSANARFDQMLSEASEVPFGKQPVIERASGEIVGYSGVASFEFEGERRFEFGYRLHTGARGNGYATEAGRLVLKIARQGFSGTILAMIDPTNEPSINVISKLGFEFWKQADVDNYPRNLYRIELP